jgi:glycosyltransferase involved in cell wall biosynthesis
MPKVSILLTCYNNLAYLGAAVDALNAQTFTDSEVIALDDGSTDGTRDWLRQFESDRFRIVFNEKNLGTYGTLNVGVGLAKGEYVAILNDDDVWAPRKLERQVAILDVEPNTGLVHTGGHFIDASGEKHPDPKPMGFEYPRTTGRNGLAQILHHNAIIASSVMIRKEVFDRCGLFDPEFYGCGDWHMWVRVADQYDVAYIDENLTYYRIHDTNAAWNLQKMKDEQFKIQQWITEQPLTERHEGDKELARAFWLHVTYMGTECLLRGDRRGARKHYLRSLRHMPLRAKTYYRLLTTFLP